MLFLSNNICVIKNNWRQCLFLRSITIIISVYVMGTVLDSGSILVTETDKSSVLVQLLFIVEMLLRIWKEKNMTKLWRKPLKNLGSIISSGTQAHHGDKEKFSCPKTTLRCHPAEGLDICKKEKKKCMYPSKLVISNVGDKTLNRSWYIRWYRSMTPTTKTTLLLFWLKSGLNWK